MTRSMQAAVSTELQANRARVRILAHFGFDSGSVRVWDDFGDLLFDGDTYNGIGNLGKVGVVKETAGLRANGLKFTLNGIPTSLISIAIGEHYQGRTCEMWRAFLDSGNALIADPVKIFAGRIDQMVVTDAGDYAEIVLTAENRLVELVRPLRTRFYTDQDQQQEFPGDLAGEFVTKMQEMVLVWGRAKLVTNLGVQPGDDPSAGQAAAMTPEAIDIPDNFAEPSGGGELGFGVDDDGNSFATSGDTPGRQF